MLRFFLQLVLNKEEEYERRRSDLAIVSWLSDDEKARHDLEEDGRFEDEHFDPLQELGHRHANQVLPDYMHESYFAWRLSGEDTEVYDRMIRTKDSVGLLEIYAMRRTAAYIAGEKLKYDPDDL